MKKVGKMQKEEIFNGITNLKIYNFSISGNFYMYIGENIRQSNPKINVSGTAYYNCESPKQKTNCYRYCLELNVENFNTKTSISPKTLVVLMLNPSNTFPEQENKKSKLDSTVKNAVRIAFKKRYNKVIIINSFSYIDGNSNTAKQFKIEDNEKKINLQIIENILSKNKDLLIAWGTKIRAKDKNQILKFIKPLKLNLFAYDLSKHSNCPYHLAQRVDSIKTGYPIRNFLENNKKLIPLKIEFDEVKNIYKLIKKN